MNKEGQRGQWRVSLEYVCVRKEDERHGGRVTRRETGGRCVRVCACVSVCMLGCEVYDYKGCGLLRLGASMVIETTGSTGCFGELLLRGWNMMMYASKKPLTLKSK